jgi:hypothetical protein
MTLLLQDDRQVFFEPLFTEFGTQVLITADGQRLAVLIAQPLQLLIERIGGVLEEDPGLPNNRGRLLRVSELGELIFGEDGLDPYLENAGTVWLLHYLLASRPDGPTTWYWAFNHLLGP